MSGEGTPARCAPTPCQQWRSKVGGGGSLLSPGSFQILSWRETGICFSSTLTAGVGWCIHQTCKNWKGNSNSWACFSWKNCQIDQLCLFFRQNSQNLCSLLSLVVLVCLKIMFQAMRKSSGYTFRSFSCLALCFLDYLHKSIYLNRVLLSLLSLLTCKAVQVQCMCSFILSRCVIVRADF